MFMKVISVREYCKATKVASVATTVRENSNGYPFVTFINDSNVAENVYFSKASGASIKQGDIVSIDMLNAYRVADYVNDNTDFGQADSEILNNSALVQIYTISSVKNDVILLERFNAVYPSNTVTGVMMRADKSYMSTQGKGNLVFKVLKNGATDEETEVETDAAAPETSDAPARTSAADLDAVTDRRSDVTAAPSAALGDKESLGRPRRR
jgi:hypothetical protein